MNASRAERQQVRAAVFAGEVVGSESWHSRSLSTKFEVWVVLIKIEQI